MAKCAPFAGHIVPLLFALLILMMGPHTTLAELPQELDPFLERLFETAECETFLSDGSFLAVATRECPPNRCEFPRQLCMRPSSQYQQEGANQCRDLPEPCLLAANGGRPLPESPIPANIGQAPSPPPIIENGQQPEATTRRTHVVSPSRPSIPSPPPSPPAPAPAPAPSPLPAPSLNHGPICEQGPPEGRFCGFSLKFSYNRETRSCDQFWFPGCRTERTNQNLFDTLQQCLHAVRHCARGDPIFRPSPPQPPIGSVNGGGLPPPSPAGPAPSAPHQPQQPRPVDTPFGQASQFIRMITNTIKEVRDRGAGGGAAQAGAEAAAQAFRWDPSQLSGLFQTFGGRK